MQAVHFIVPLVIYLFVVVNVAGGSYASLHLILKLQQFRRESEFVIVLLGGIKATRIFLLYFRIPFVQGLPLCCAFGLR